MLHGEIVVSVTLPLGLDVIRKMCDGWVLCTRARGSAKGWRAGGCTAKTARAKVFNKKFQRISQRAVSKSRRGSWNSKLVRLVRVFRSVLPVWRWCVVKVASIPTLSQRVERVYEREPEKPWRTARASNSRWWFFFSFIPCDRVLTICNIYVVMPDVNYSI